MKARIDDQLPASRAVVAKLRERSAQYVPFDRLWPPRWLTVRC
jgi:hypothetical protein